MLKACNFFQFLRTDFVPAPRLNIKFFCNFKKLAASNGPGRRLGISRSPQPGFFYHVNFPLFCHNYFCHDV